MGNTMLTPCFYQNPNSCSSSSSVKLIFWEGTTRILTGKRHIAGEIMFQFPEMMVCHADSFFIGRPVPALAIDDELMLGQTYFVLPIDRLGCTGVLSAASLAALGSCPSRSPIKFGQCPFEYLKGTNGRAMIKVKPEFIMRLIVEGDQNKDDNKEDIVTTGENGNNNINDVSPSRSFLCSTPELQKHYEQLVRSKDQVWSPKLETISEYKIRFSVSPCSLIGLQWKQREKSENNVYY